MAIDWQALVDATRSHHSFLLTSHMRPDCDALGSELALAGALRALGKQVHIVNGDPVPEHIAFMDLEHQIQVLGERFTAEEAAACDAVVILDTSSWLQLGPMADVVHGMSATKLLIDHHVSADDMEAIELKDTSAEATGRLVLEACEALGVTIRPEMAFAMFAAIATDTGWFRFASVTDKTFIAAGKLVAAGARPAEIFAALYERHNLSRLKLHGRVQDHARTDLGGRLIWSYVTQRDFEETGAQPTDTEDVVNRLLSVGGVEVAAIFLEVGPDRTKGSLRSRSDVDVRQVAERFGGGGHTAAAGLRYDGPLAEAQVAVLDALREAMG